MADAIRERAEGTCERCLARDGREVETYELAGKGDRDFCAQCAEITGAVHDLKPKRKARAAMKAEPPSEPASTSESKED